MQGNPVSRVLPTVLLILIATLLALLLLRYEGKLGSLLLEGNKMYSSQAAIVEDGPGPVLDRLPQLGWDACAFLLSADDGGMRLVAANDFEAQEFPLYQGSGFTNEGAREALIGAEVETESDGGKEYYLYHDQRYEVRGRLGTKPDSLLQKDVLLKDDALFRTMEASALVLDGTSAAARYHVLAPAASIQAFDFGADRRTSVDAVSPVLFGIGGCLVLAGYLCAGLLYGYRMAAKNRVLDVLGVSRRRIYGRQSGMLAVLAAGSFAAAFCFCAAVSPNHLPSLGAATCAGALVVATTVAASMIPALAKRGGRRAGDRI